MRRARLEAASVCTAPRNAAPHAVAELEQAIGYAGEEPLLLAALAHARAFQGRRAEALAMLEKMRALATRRYVSAYQTALVHVGLGDFDAGFGQPVLSICVSSRGSIRSGSMRDTSPSYDG